MRYTTVKNELFISNRLNFRSLIPPATLALFVAGEKKQRNGDQYFPFRQQSDFFYLTGIEHENSKLLIFPDCPNPKFREILFVEAIDEEKAIWNGNMLTKEEASVISGINNVFTLDQFDQVLQECMNYALQVYLNNNEYIKFNPATESTQTRLAKNLREKYPLHEFCRAAPLLESLRTIKSFHEIEIIRKACNITGKAFERVLEKTRPDIYEFEVEAEISHTFTVNRSNGHGYSPIIATGINACTLHYTSNNSLLKDGDLLLLDFGAEYANYTADLSRTIPVSGRFNERQRNCYEAVLRVFKAAVPLYKSGNTIDNINEAVWKMMEEEMILLGLFSRQDVINQNPAAPLFRGYLMHGVAHHIGLDVHDVGSKYTPLAPGMVLTCEPGLYIREEGIGIRIENDILITDGEPVDLMRDIPLEISDIELLMNS
ncbi:MAG: X-Pro aminopeptidase [Bacteroidetes bacterium HGW-Bacteroidetes-1]|jgi:Xaa-Pro aminopeptidase|nr:MAG: X-Pro aminopeptidase [Bacteroidetes bacterium HGW-Bacteroidetes-1]